MADGCTEAGAPWAQEFGWGYGGRLSVAEEGGHIYTAYGTLLGQPSVG